MLTPAADDPNRQPQLKKHAAWIKAGMPNRPGPDQNAPAWGWIAHRRPADWTPTKERGLRGAQMSREEAITRAAHRIRFEQGVADIAEATRRAVTEVDEQGIPTPDGGRLSPRPGNAREK